MTGDRRELSDLKAHEHAMEIPIAQVVQELVDLLGAPTVAVLGGVQETRAVQQWMHDRMPQNPHILRFALQLALMVASGGDKLMAQAWFNGSNPHLGDRAPIFLFREGELEEIQTPLLTAARSFAARERPGSA